VNFFLDGKVALVTGGSHGIGKEIALALSDEGCRVAICAREKAGLSSLVNKITSEGRLAIGISADVLRPQDIDGVVRDVVSAWGTVHILINNVGGGGRWGKPSVEETDEEVWVDVYSKNALAAVRFTRLVLPHMRKQRWGRIVTIASIHGKEGGGRPWFVMAKSAEISLMKSLAMDAGLAGDGITFNSVSPGRIMIPDTGWEAEKKKDPSEFDRMVRESLPQGRMGKPEEVAAVVAFLCSERAGLVNGANVAVDGGEGRSF
jgi:3-oxoacyl-[acyl-carrier protein] reductase